MARFVHRHFQFTLWRLAGWRRPSGLACLLERLLDGGFHFGESGFTLGSKRAMRAPSRPTRNLVSSSGYRRQSANSDLSVRKRYSGLMSSPFTELLAYSGKVTW